MGTHSLRMAALLNVCLNEVGPVLLFSLQFAQHLVAMEFERGVKNVIMEV